MRLRGYGSVDEVTFIEEEACVKPSELAATRRAMRPTDCEEEERDAMVNEAENEMVLPHIAGGLDVDEHNSGRESKSAEPSRAQHQEEGGEGKVGRGGCQTKRKQRTIIGLGVGERQHAGGVVATPLRKKCPEPLDMRALLPQLRKKCPEPLDMTEVEMADLVAQWVAQEDSNPSKELERIWHGSASHASNSYSSHRKIDEHCSFQDDIQTLVGTLMVIYPHFCQMKMRFCRAYMRECGRFGRR
jgi:hypothetical protein